MSNYSMIYWLTRLDAIRDLCMIMAVFLTIYLVIIGIIKFVDNEDNVFNIGKIKTKLWIVVVVILFAFYTFIPSKNEMILIIAGGETLDFIQDDKNIQKIPEQTTEIIATFLDQKLKELNEPDK